MFKLFKKKRNSSRNKKIIDNKENQNASSGKTIYFSYKKRSPIKRSRAIHKVKINKIYFHNYSYLIYIGLIVTLIFVFVVLIRTISIGRINCKTTISQACDEDISAILSKYKDSKLYSSYNLISTDLKNEPSIEEFVIAFDISNLGWNVEILPKSPVSAITNKNMHKFLFVADNGYVISTLDSNNLSLPLLVVASDLPEKGVLLDKSVVFALSIIRDFKFMYNVDYGSLTPDGLVIELDSKKRVLFPLEGDREVLVGGVMYILGRLEKQTDITKQEKDLLMNYFEIDMRFENPVLRPFVR